MIKYGRYLLSIALLLSFFILTIGCQPSDSSKSPKIEIYTFPPKSSVPTPEQPQNLPELPVPGSTSTQDYVERRIVVDERNNVFSIGVPANNKEETEVIAERPIDFWFGYVPDDLKLEVDGAIVQRSLHWELKIKYTTGATKFKYVATNSTTNDKSYNLYLVPTRAGDSVSVIVRQRWSRL
jgi:hypothetical protein